MTATMSASLRTRVMLLFLALASIFTPVVARAERIPQTIDNENPMKFANPMKLKISTVGGAVLRQQSRPLPVAEIRGAEIQQLIQHMRETMNDAPGVGLAAPQVGMPLQLVVIEDKQEYFAGFSPEQIAERERQPVPFHVIINPVLHVESGPDVEFFEGCLSLPGYTAIVPRARKVRVECLDHHGAPQIIEASGWYARILQHEIEHLQGMLYLDRMLGRTFCSLDNYTRWWKTKTVDQVKEALGCG